MKNAYRRQIKKRKQNKNFEKKKISKLRAICMDFCRCVGALLYAINKLANYGRSITSTQLIFTRH